MPYFFKTACGLPQILQRVYALVENLAGLFCLAIIDFFAIYIFSLSLSVLERHSKLNKECFGVVVGRSRSYHTDIESADFFNGFVSDFGEHDLFLNAHCVVSSAVEGL